jgi:hypothetical protein
MFRRRFGRVVLSLIVFLAGCHGSTSHILAPLEKNASAAKLFNLNASQVTSENVSSPALRSPDGVFELRQPHDSRVHLHLGVFTKRRDGYINQREYVTPFGMVILTQKARSTAQTSTTSSELRASAASTDSTSPIADGVTSHGAHWYLLAIEDNRWEVHVQFKDATVDAGVPEGTPVSVVRQLVEELY